MGFNINRYKNRIVQEYELEIITPMFLGGAEPNSAELRTASIKGMLRFWWRALYGSNDLKKMKGDEDNIFGSTNKKSDLVIKILSENIVSKIPNGFPKGDQYPVPSKPFKPNIIDYLAYGLHDYKKGVVYHTKCILPGINFLLTVTYNQQYEREINNALNFLINFGGLGSRSRNGFGSMRIINKQSNISFQNSSKKSLVKFTAISKETKLFLFKSRNTWEEALSKIGIAYKDARLYLEKKRNFEKRGLVAMPIEVKHEIIPDYIKKGRHAKPYFLHVNKLDNGKYQGKILFMPYEYYKSNKRDEYIEACNQMNKYIEDNFEVEVKNVFS